MRSPKYTATVRPMSVMMTDFTMRHGFEPVVMRAGKKVWGGNMMQNKKRALSYALEIVGRLDRYFKGHGIAWEVAEAKKRELKIAARVQANYEAAQEARIQKIVADPTFAEKAVAAVNAAMPEIVEKLWARHPNNSANREA